METRTSRGNCATTQRLGTLGRFATVAICHAESRDRRDVSRDAIPREGSAVWVIAGPPDPAGEAALEHYALPMPDLPRPARKAHRWEPKGGGRSLAILSSPSVRTGRARNVHRLGLPS